MNEELTRQLIKLKLNAANSIISHLPPEISEEIKGLGRLIIMEANETLKALDKQPANKTKRDNKLDNIEIE